MRTPARLLVDIIAKPELIRGITLSQWDDLIRLARASNLLSKLAESIHSHELGDLVPKQPAQHIVSASILSNHQRQAIVWELNHIAHALGDLDIPLILLKGAAYVYADLPVARGRLFGDVDLLVPKDSIPKVEAALMMHGWVSNELDAYNQRYYRQWMHELPPMVHIDRGTMIDVHHSILPLTAHPDLQIGQMMREAWSPGKDSQFMVLSPVDMVIHSATHLFYEGELKNGLRDLFDLDSLLIHFSSGVPDFWDTLVRRAVGLGLARPVSYAFRYCQRLLSTPIPETACKEIEGYVSDLPLARRIIDASYGKALCPDYGLASDLWTSLARFMLYIRGHALRMPFGLLIRHLGRKALMRLATSTDPVDK
jgi:hypothetical protein